MWRFDEIGVMMDMRRACLLHRGNTDAVCTTISGAVTLPWNGMTVVEAIYLAGKISAVPRVDKRHHTSALVKASQWSASCCVG